MKLVGTWHVQFQSLSSIYRFDRNGSLYTDGFPQTLVQMDDQKPNTYTADFPTFREEIMEVPGRDDLLKVFRFFKNDTSVKMAILPGANQPNAPEVARAVLQTRSRESRWPCRRPPISVSFPTA